MSGVPYDQWGWWRCDRTSSISTPPVSYSIGQETSVCTGYYSTFDITPLPPSGSVVRWYKYEPANSCDPCPPADCPLSSDWVLDQTGGNTYNTNLLTKTTCYVATIQDGCSIRATNVKRVEVCPGLPSSTIIIASLTPPTTINNVPHACRSWSGELCLDPSTFPCCSTEIIRWEKRIMDISETSTCDPKGWVSSGWVTIPSSDDQTCINTGVLGLVPPACKRKYEFRAVLKNACGTSNPTYTIIIDRPPIPGQVSLVPGAPSPPLCYKKATKLEYSSECAEVVEWEMSEEITPCSNDWGNWTVVPGSQGTCVWWTNNLLKTTKYRVKVKNGACPMPGDPSVYSSEYIVEVKPDLSVTIAANNNNTVLCTPVALIAQTTWGAPCNYSVTYQWYKDGLPIFSATSQIYSPTTGGNYYVVADGGPCGQTESNVITVCDIPQLVITGPCCVCPDETITLTAQVLWSPPDCQPQSCTYLWNTGATTPAIQVTSPGQYTVTVNCEKCELTQSFYVDDCQKPTSCDCFEWESSVVEYGDDTYLVLNGGTLTLPVNLSAQQPVTITPTLICMPPTCEPSYTWEYTIGLNSFNGTSVPISFTPTIAGQYTVLVKGKCGTEICPQSIEIFIDVIPIIWWFGLIKDGILTGEDDPVNRALNDGRRKLAKTVYGASIEKWYADLNKKDWISVMLKDHADDVTSLLSVGRKLIQENGVLNKSDLAIIVKVLRILDRKIIPAPEGLIEESQKRFRSSIGKKWNQVLENLVR